MSIQVNLEPIDTTDASPYLGRTINFKKSDWAALYLNLRKAQGRWGMVVKVPTKTIATVRARLMIYKAVVQMVLLYSSESWV